MTPSNAVSNRGRRWLIGAFAALILAGGMLWLRSGSGGASANASARGQFHAHRLQARKPAARGADLLRDRLGQRHVRRVQVDVVGNEKLPRAHHRGAGGRWSAASPKSGRRSGLLRTSSRTPSNWPRRMFSRFLRSGRRAAACTSRWGSGTGASILPPPTPPRARSLRA